MFIKEAEIKRLFKDAYKGVGLRIASDENGLVFTGRTWYIYVFRENLPKEIKGAVIALTGEIPPIGTQVLYNAEGEQTELFKADPAQDVYKRALEAEAEDCQARPADIILLDHLERPYRVVTDERDEVFTVPERFCMMADPGNCGKDEEYKGCFALPSGWLYWLSEHMAYGFPSFVIDEAIRGRAMKLKEAGII